MDALRSWAEQLQSWAIPADILAAVPDSPWVMPTAVFARRADRHLERAEGPTHATAAAALAPGGDVLDVGSGAGAASLPLGPLATTLTAVDTSADMLSAYAERAARFGVPVRTVRGRWPDLAADVAVADVVVCAHVLYNVADIGPFATALTSHARRLVVCELTERHPLTPLNPLWQRLHRLTRPTGPSAVDAVSALQQVGIIPEVSTWDRAAEADHDSFEDFVDVTRRRLCLPPERADDVAAALRAEGLDPAAGGAFGALPRRVVTLAWPGTG